MMARMEERGSMKSSSAVCCYIGGLAILVATVPALAQRVGQRQGGAKERGAQDATPRERPFAGAGRWKGRGERADQGGGRPWRIHAVQRDDGSVAAKLSIPGMSGLEDVTIEGQVIGQDAFGVLLDNNGVQKATFNARFSPDGSGGSFILGTGESGTWDYDSATKAALPKGEKDAGEKGHR